MSTSFLRENQAGFCKRRSCAQQVRILRRLTDVFRLKNLPFVLTFVDFKKALDSINREMLFAVLRNLPTRGAQYNYVNGSSSDTFSVATGILQGDVLAPFIYIIAVDYLLRQQSTKSPLVLLPTRIYLGDIQNNA